MERNRTLVGNCAILAAMISMGTQSAAPAQTIPLAVERVLERYEVIWPAQRLDIDGDGDEDALIGAAYSSEVYLYENRLAEGEGYVVRLFSDQTRRIPFPRALGAADFDGDSDQDIFGSGLISGPGGSFWIELENGALVPGSERRLITDRLWDRALTMDLDGDSLTDVLARAPDWRFYRNPGPEATGQWNFTILSPQPGNLIRADLTGNGVQDLFFIRGNSVVYLDVTPGNPPVLTERVVDFTTAKDMNAGDVAPDHSQSPPSVVDIDGDGDIDLALSPSSFAINSGDGSAFVLKQAAIPDIQEAGALAGFFDQNGDGRVDMVLGPSAESRYTVYGNQGLPDPAFELAGSVAINGTEFSSYWQSVGNVLAMPGRLNLDAQDLLIASTTGIYRITGTGDRVIRNVVIREPNGNGVFRAGERGEIEFTIDNRLGFVGEEETLYFAADNAVLDQSVFPVGDIPVGESVTITVGFTVAPDGCEERIIARGGFSGDLSNAGPLATSEPIEYSRRDSYLIEGETLVNIPDSGSVQISGSSNRPGTITGVRYAAVVSHTRRSDILLTLSTESGKKHEYRFAEAGAGIGTYETPAPLDSFNGLPASTRFTLSVEDTSGGHRGYVGSWYVEVLTGDCSTGSRQGEGLLSY